MGQPLQRVEGPNLYFILDRSGSMSEIPPGTTETKWQFVRGDIADLMTDLGREAQFGAAEFPQVNTELTLADDCQTGTEVMTLRQGDGLPASTTGSTANAFLGATSAPPSGGTPTADTFNALAPELTSLKGHTFAVLATDGGPNCNLDPNNACGVETCTANIDQLQCAPAAPRCAPGGVNCCIAGSMGCPGPVNCLDEARTVAAVYALAHPQQGNGVPTFIIGVPGTDVVPYPDVLDSLAVAGGTARATEPFYYPVTDPSSLASALADIAARIAVSCTIELEDPPSDPSQVNVVVDGRVVPQSGANGWTLSGSIVSVFGANCDEVYASGHSPVVTSGCPTVTSAADAGSPEFMGNP
jgi:hypothetical protein